MRKWSSGVCRLHTFIDEPEATWAENRPTIIASDDRGGKEKVARMAFDIGQDPIDAGPLRMSRAIEAQVLLFMVPIYQRRSQNWENVSASIRLLGVPLAR